MTTGHNTGGELTGRVLAGRYRVTAQLGRGGMGVVCRAVDETLGRDVALKVLRAYNDASPAELADLRTRMEREARAAARIRHTGVITVYDVVQEDGCPVIVMEFVDGPSLDGVLGERGAMDPREAAAIGAEVMDALDAAHQAGVLHRDVKPGNVLLDRTGRIVLTDFGIASMEAPGDDAATKLTRSGELVGSLDFLPPERAQGDEPGPAGDVWSLGMTLYAAVEGSSPFRRTSVWSTLTAIVTEPLPQPQRAGSLGPVLQALTAKDPAARPTAAQAREMLQAVAAGHADSVAPPPAAAGASFQHPAPPPAGFGPHGAPAHLQAPAPAPAPGVAAGYPPPGAPHPAPAVTGNRGTRPVSTNRRSGITVAATAAAVVLVAGGVAWAVMGSNSSGGTTGGQAVASVSASGTAPSAGAAKTGLTSPGASSAAASTGARTHSGDPKNPGSRSHGSPSAPAATNTPVVPNCYNWNHQDPHPGTYAFMTGNYNLKAAPYEECPNVAPAANGAKVWFGCYVTNAYGNTWEWVRIDGQHTSGWMTTGHLSTPSGPMYRC